MKPVEAAVWFIEGHRGEPIGLTEIASVAGVSRFHLVRVFGLATGFPVMRYVRARRLTEAAKALAAGAPDILAVALEAGYGSHEAFTRAFRDQFGTTPEAARAAGTVNGFSLVEPITMTTDTTTPLPEPRIEPGRTMLVAGLRDHFAFEALGGLPALWQRVAARLGQIPGQVGHVAYGVCYGMDGSGFDYLAGVEVAPGTDVPSDLASIRVAAPRYAVFTHAGHVSTVRTTFMAIFNDWLPRSGYQFAEAPVFERYDERFDPHTGKGGFELWIPIR
ncbi:MAG: AraC family transcriptional regulator [Proteobacteria bacterium]|nr:AraC family transcriptional regulator [Pseudomonadota bacterium]